MSNVMSSFTVSERPSYFGIFLVENVLSNCVNVFLYYFRYFGINLAYFQRTVEQTHHLENIKYQEGDS